MARIAHVPADRTAGSPSESTAHRALVDDPVVWLSSVQRDGRPHVVPVWFHWDGERIVAFSKPNARKVDNLRDQPQVMLAVGTPGPDFEVELIEATAELPEAPAAEWMPDGFGAKYRELLDWYASDYVGVARGAKREDPLLAIRGVGKEIWKGEGADEYVRRLRRGWS